ncbi:hypothetical protein DPV78_001314 [Talaromyces pinophilus]|nr:hypothetical protein DPV78_001314 [Talaromyces pinophilus]
MDQQVARGTNAAAQTPLNYQRLFEEFLSKSNECNALALQIQKLEQENATFRLQLQLQRSPANHGSFQGTLEARIQAENTRMVDYVKVMRAQLDSTQKKIKEQQETIEGMRNDIRRTRDFPNTQFKLDA